MTSKTLLRAEMKARLAEMSAQDREDAGLRIRERILGLSEMQDARTVLLYASLPGEVSTDQLAAELRRMGVRVTYPRCLPATREMTLHAVASGGELLVDGPYGIREPSTECELVGIGDIDIALMPGLAWDREGQRLGRGAGYYDRLLADPRWRGLRFGVFFAVQEIRLVPADPWDVPMNLVVTENETARFAKL
jgi:5-formyltetrahydrofolate cyclo-ligase